MQQDLFESGINYGENNVTERTNKLYRDAIFKDIELTPLAIDIIDTPEFQRLDGIQQLGFASLVYRNAKHTRFDHSIGVYHESQNMMRLIRNNHIRFKLPPPENILKGLDSNNNEKKFNVLVEIIGISALLHDITHIPSGHALEDELKSLYLKHDHIKSLRLYYILYDDNSNIKKIFDSEDNYLPLISNHELKDLIFLILKYKYEARPYVSFEETLETLIINEQNEKYDDSKKDRMKMLIKLREINAKFTNEKNVVFEPFMSEIISNTISADLLEYLKRDVWGTGLDHSVDSRIEKYFVIKTDSITQKNHLVIELHGPKGLRLDTISAIIQLMETRYALAEKVYYHKTKVAADVMLGRLLEKIERPPDLNPYSLKTIDNVITMKESDLYTYIKEKVKSTKNSFTEELLKMLQNRDLYKLCIVIPKSDITGAETEIISKYFRSGVDSKKNISNFQNKLNSIFMDNNDHVLLFCPPLKPHAKEIGVFVEDKDINTLSKTIDGDTNIPKAKKDQIINLGEMYHLLWKFFVFIHPEDYKNELSRHAIIVKFCQIFKEVIGPTAELNKDLILGRKYTINYNSPEDVFEKWEMNKTWPHSPDGRILQRLRNINRDDNKWIENIINARNEFDNFNDFCDDLYFKELKECYLSKGIRININSTKFLTEVIQIAGTREIKGTLPEGISNLPHYRELHAYKAFSFINS